MERPITGFRLDEEGDWVAILGRGHPMRRSADSVVPPELDYRLEPLEPVRFAILSTPCRPRPEAGAPVAVSVNRRPAAAACPGSSCDSSSRRVRGSPSAPAT